MQVCSECLVNIAVLLRQAAQPVVTTRLFSMGLHAHTGGFSY